MALDVEIYGKNIEVNERIHQYVDKKVSKLDKYLNGVDQARVDLAYVKSARSASDRQVAQITVRGKGIILRSEERSDDIFAALDAALEKLQRQMERYKGKHYRGRGNKGSPVEAMVSSEVTEEEVESQTPIIARRKQFRVTPMDELEAIDQMNLLGHEDFFVFYNIGNNRINVIYRRRDGSYGLIDPEVA